MEPAARRRDALAAPQAAWGYLPFFGHNAVLRIDELRRQGGFTPGFFSDDLDYSVRLTLAGRRIVYRSDIAFGERHPTEWGSFRRRARKWAFGCMQVVRVRARRVLVTPGVPLAHRVGMLEFMGFYPAQALLLAGLLASHLVLPWLAPARHADAWLLASGTLVVGALLAPTLAWAVRARQLARWPSLAWTCALVYGGSILPTVRGVVDGLSTRPRPWVPTNLAHARRAVPRVGWAECGLGLVLLAVPWTAGSATLEFPASYLFMAVFLYAPLTWAAYRAPAPAAARARERVALERAVATLALALALVGFAPARARAERVGVHGASITVDGRAYEVRGVHYSPWLPGTGPGHGAYPSDDVVARDLAAIRDLGANTVLLTDAPSRVIARAHALGLHSIVAFDIGWNDTSRAAFDAQAARVVAHVDSMRAAPGVLMWILGHEVPTWVVDQLGAGEVAGRLRALAATVRAHDGAHLLGHGNWPPTRQLDLSFLDVACFNLYPAWPYEVAVRGYGPYLREVLVPAARGRPLLVSEFGINSLEAGEARQAQVIGDCWREIQASHVAGGVVFEWCDEWWKNWDNPIPGRDYWQRRYDPDDAARHDADPEEYYGIVRADRSAKPALAAVRQMWRGEEPRRSSVPWIVLAGLGAATWFGFGLRRGTRRPGATTPLVIVGVCALGAAAPARGAVITDTVYGDQSNAQFGWTLAGPGDLTATGSATLAVGAHFYTVNDTAAGAVFLWFAGSPSGSAPFLALYGTSAHEHFGESIAGQADVDGDGVPELAIGAPLRSTGGLSSNGSVDLFRGGALAAGPWRSYHGEASDDWFGQSVALGDVDGDGRADVIVGAPYNDRGGSAAGAVFIYRGADPPGSPPWRVLVGQAANDQFGWSVAYVGDVNGDGYGDVVVGARLHTVLAKSSCGRAYLFHGGPAMSVTAAGTWDGEARDDWFGNCVAGVGDVDGGGRPDILVGAPYNDRGGSAAGAAYLFRGEDPPGSAPVAIYVGESANAQFGWSVAGAGDVNGDGHADVLAGARMQASGALTAAGRAYLFAGGAALSTTPIATVDGHAANDWFGNCVANGIGYFHVGRGAMFAGAPYDDTLALDAGSALAAQPATAAAAPSMSPALPTLSAWPSPATGRVWLRVAAAAGSRLVLRDPAGRVVRTFAAIPAEHTFAWDGRDARGVPAPPGVYFAELEGAGVRRVGARIVLVR
ncbi:MAG TPA: FG-GAP-like repeat-containing protein [Candidatus Eisenbacteria bacterium]|nr:FG-GAP-like repeat-containing protein [Candidatus Eisenbacteria bacterium]